MRANALPRRAFLQLSGATAAGVVLAGCGGDDEEQGGGAQDQTQTQMDQQADVTLDFSNPTAVLNYAYALEQLEAAFYTRVIENQYANITDKERSLLDDIRAHEVAHREFFQAKLGDQAIGALKPNFSKVDFSSRDSVLSTAQTFENLGVWAYNGAASLIDTGGPLGVAPLLAAGDIVSVEARHASAIGAIIDPGRGSFAVDAFDKALPPSEVLGQAAPFLETTIAVKNVPEGQS